MKELLTRIISNPEIHAKWINTLSMMENSGARKISASEHPTQVNLIILKHAAEEARHAYYLKSKIRLTGVDNCPTYGHNYLIAPIKSYHYLSELDLAASRYIKNELNLSGYDLRFVAYLLVTYAIEVRADDLYPKYQEVLTELGSKISVKTIIAEEEGHLEEMQAQLKAFDPEWERHANNMVEVEERLFQKWWTAVETELAGNA